VRGGLRAEYNDLTEKAGLDPRVSLAYKTGDPGQVSFAYGRFRQSAGNEWIRLNPELGQEKAEHFILNYQRVSDNRTFRIETYYKRYDDLTKFSENDAAVLTNSGNGYAKGIELFWRDNQSLKHVDYWISYSYLDTKRDYLGFPNEAVPTFASRHNFSAVYKHFLQPIQSQLGLTYSFTSGRPYHDPNRNTFNGGRTPGYSDLSFTWSYLPKPWLIVYFSCTNLLGRDNVFGYEFSNQRNEDGQYASRAVRQAAKRFVFLALLITFSKDKSMNQLPSL
ncbi:MAG TPA: TonB-dependent receptor, partial [Ohtaekwangia sp.]|nr:TonB-dependent receptor [Ohtaekwangia sp.]